MKRLLPPIACLLLAACSATPPQPLRLHQLSAQTTPANGAQTLPYNLGIGPLTWPPYLDHRPLVRRENAGSLRLAENDRWVEPLDVNFLRVLRENLARSLTPQRLQAHPWALNDVPAVSVPLEILQFDSDIHGETVLRARWRVIVGKRSGPERNSEYRVSTGSGNAPAVVAAQSEALARLATDIAAALPSRLPE
ncbi:MAG: hypothetical protein CGU28_09970 [Candidatus Dactylopiibacterium carminicum]|uniref:ABC-type transport auxiliary lipoprotein component domain-containing protein n=1 Tax=Candidatus Dactylopiibacterium carminicum TaxID=857335 RepID=A0A272ER80_9RHOO|nr:PqiC family protein [Candidatus Dactylopiibacterium carminicum]KAF7598716.1 hypothetical protein BGI27_11625 [Candidatus Dactylopiibacterium carminicum]PAS92627.1 MAG: hypothetical protein CGU29_10710 [Candidatus Dactylopiibacterium carminicum]PAS96117.1 MAG: hypothetical protein CGU28_09970 [Candidatus Dactylopiibacterium carminicum]PAS98735.1 MAG: hypothetical protein BSR46_11640 [Candidatus Dactylopiibacterium carminicum]